MNLKTLIYFLIILFSVLSEECIFGDSLPDFNICNGSFKINSYLKVASSLEALPKSEAIEAFKQYASLNNNISVIILCRMLFTPKQGQELRRPKIGGAIGYLGMKSPDDLFSVNSNEQARKCPLDPIVLIDNIPFMVAESYMSSGPPPESAADYLSYCIQNGIWAERRFHVASKKEMEIALSKLLEFFPQRPLTKEELESLKIQMR